MQRAKVCTQSIQFSRGLAANGCLADTILLRHPEDGLFTISKLTN